MPTTAKLRNPSNDRDWEDLSYQFRIRPDTLYLNHGSFGLSPDCVRYARREFTNRLDENPMDFYLRDAGGLMENARQRLASFVGTEPRNLVFVDNATYAMNVVAVNFPLSAGDEVILSDHEYGAVFRIWQRTCERSDAKVVTANLPEKIETADEVIAHLLASVTNRTKLLVISHITSPTALILPVQQICQAFSQRGIAICIDGPHAPAQVELNIDELGCDFYAASCHKWLCGPLGTGFLYCHPRWQQKMEPIVLSWGQLLPAIPKSWDEEFCWLGTRDPANFLAVPVAIDFLERIDLESFRNRSRWLAEYIETALVDLLQTQTIGNRKQGFYGSMAHVPLPPGDWSGLQRALWEQAGIEVVINQFVGRWFIRVSCHLYNNTIQLDTLVKALQRLLVSFDRV